LTFASAGSILPSKNELKGQSQMTANEKKPKKPRNIWTLLFAQMFALETRGIDLEIDYEHEFIRGGRYDGKRQRNKKNN